MKMSKRKMIVAAAILVFAAMVNILIIWKVRPVSGAGNAEVKFGFWADQSMEIQLFYKEDVFFSAEKVNTVSYSAKEGETVVSFPIDTETKFIRLDLGDLANHAMIDSIVIEVGNTQFHLTLDRVANPILTNCVEGIAEQNGKIYITSQDIDPWVVLSIEDVDLAQAYRDAVKTKNIVSVILLCLAVDLAALLCVRNIETLFRVPFDLYKDRSMFWDLVKNDFQARFAGSYFGIFWAFINPFITILLYWFVFQVGLRAGNVSNYPFILFLMSGQIPWFYFSESLSGATGSLMEYSYLVKKVVFNVGILPVIKVASSLFVHLFFVGFIMIICTFYGFTPDLYCLQLIYYMICMVFLVLGISYVTSACTAFFKDMTQVINIALTIGFWVTPILWNPVGTMSKVLILVFRLNPFYYIVDGFRDALLAKSWFWEKPVWTIYFWILCVMIYLAGVKMFNRLKVHFSDVL